MEQLNLQNLEKSIILKRNFFSKGIMKSPAMYPPIAMIFIGILGILYLYNYNLLLSAYTIPFLCFFLAGSILIRIIKKQVIEKRIAENTVFCVCETIPFLSSGNKTILLFSIDENRHKKSYLDNNKNTLSKDEREKIKSFKSNSLKSKITQLAPHNLYITTAPPRSLSFTNSNNTDTDYKIIYSGNEKFSVLSSNKIRRILLKKRSKK